MNAVAERYATAMPIVEIEGLPYIDPKWLELRIYREEVRAKRWRQEARRTAKNAQLHTSYLLHAMQATYRAEKWRKCLAQTRFAISSNQVSERLSFGDLVKQRRKAAGFVLSALGDRAGVCKKTIRHIENAAHQPTLDTITRILSVPELGLTWDDVEPALLEQNPADGRKNRKRRKPRIKKPHGYDLQENI